MDGANSALPFKSDSGSIDECSRRGARLGSGPVTPDADARELLRLLTPHGGRASRLRILDFPLPWPAIASRRAGDLSDDDLLVVRTHAPRIAQRVLRRRGLQASVYAVAPSVEHARLATPLSRPVRGGRSFRAVLSRASIRLHARELAGREAQVVLFVTRKAAPGRWIAEMAQLEGARLPVTAKLSWRGRRGGAIALVGEGGGKAAGRFVKIAFDTARAEHLRREHALLRSVAATVPGATVAVPRVIALNELDGTACLIEDLVEGSVAAGLKPREIEVVFARLAAWLQAWHEATLDNRDGAEHEALDLVDLGGLAAASDGDLGYRQWLLGASKADPEATAFRVAVHGDLTLWNLIVASPSGPIWLVDWEDASPQGPPLSDLFYAAVDAELASGVHDRRLQAFDAIFPAPRTQIGAECKRVSERLGLAAGAVRLAFHETWLRHAANEVGRGDQSDFQEIVHNRLAVHPERYPWGERE
jgi:aminoglycoside phosphotransferase (APT) family kinase protein